MGRPVLWLTWLTLGYFLVLELMLIPAIYYWPVFEENVDALKLVAPIPALKDLVATIGDEGAFAYFAGQHFFKAGNTVGTIAAVLFAVGAVAGEAYRGTLETWLARPFSRRRILTERYLLGALATTVPIFLSSASAPLLAQSIDEYFAWQPLLLGSIHQSCLLLCIYSVVFLASTLGSNPIRIAIVVLLVTAFQFAIYFVEEVTHWSFYRMSDLKDYLRIEGTGQLDLSICLPLLGGSLVAYVLSVLAFERRLP